MYCQHVLGVGHFFRALEICRAMKGHDVVLITGGAPVESILPENVREIRLPPLMMDRNFSGIYSHDRDKSVEQAKSERRDFFYRCFIEERPDILIVELYPFGRKAFRFELDPVLKGICNGTLPPCRVVCSLRDILVEKDDVESYEKRVIKTLNQYFDALLVHSDPDFLRLDTTFSRMDEITVPVHYTGFVASMPDRGKTLSELWPLPAGSDASCQRIIVSVGGGNVGRELLIAVVNTIALINRSEGFRNRKKIFVKLFSGHFMDDETFSFLKQFESEFVQVSRFTSDFLNLMSLSDLSISMAGYNTCMNILASGVPAIVWPFDQNREQRLRATLLSYRHPIKVLSDDDLAPEKFSVIIQEILDTSNKGRVKINLSGAVNSARLIVLPSIYS
ncbi:putative glycosyl transferase family protein [Desulfamplus magnetovallimortis]|uniref:Putative glycosyl transferase family protein n=2 Tax=Desulfamplus magnetovallimortis TaxID=1246637 RepID=A0A1W1H6N9_9BACT|nr:putative glycosyl transferase family protein [Desulfamplus magnetovallimortis]